MHFRHTIFLAMILAGLGCFGLAAAPARAQEPVRLTAEQGQYTLGLHLAILSDPTYQLTIDRVASPEFDHRFEPSQEKIPNFGYLNTAIWVRFELANTTSEAAGWLLEIGDPTINSIDLYLAKSSSDPSSSFITKHTGDLIPFARRDVAHHLLAFELPLEPQTSYTAYLRVENSGSTALSLTLWSPEAFAQKNYHTLFLLGFYYGFIFIMVCYNLFLFFFLRELSYFYYVLCVASIGLYNMTTDGLANQYLWPTQPWWGHIAILVFIGLALLNGLNFGSRFLLLKEHAPTLHTIMIGLKIVSVLLIVLAFFPANYQLVGQSLSVLTLLVGLTGILAGLAAWRQGYYPARYFLAAWAGVIGGAVLVALGQFQLLPLNFLTEYGVRIGVFLLVLLLSLALADRINLLKAEAETASRRLSENEDRLLQFLEAMPIGVSILDRQAATFFTNQQAKEILNIPPPAFPTDSSPEILPSASFYITGTDREYPSTRIPFKQALQGHPAHADNIEIDQAGHRIPLEIWARPIFDEQGQISYAISAFQDITARKQTEKELEAYRLHLEELVSERTTELVKAVESLEQQITERKQIEKKIQQQNKFLNNIIESLSDPFYVINVDHCTVEIANSAAQSMGIARTTPCYVRTYQQSGQCDPLTADCPLAMVRQKKEPVIAEYIHWDQAGRPVNIEVHRFPVFNEHGDIIQVIEYLVDITARKQAEEELRKLSRAVEQSASTIVITDLTGQIEFINPAFSLTTGYSYEEAIGQNPRILKSGHHPPELYQDLWDALTRGETWQGELLNKKKDGELYWESATISPIKDGTGKITHYLAVKDDITSRKEAEAALQQANEQLQRRLEELSTLNRLMQTVTTVTELPTVLEIMVREMTLIFQARITTTTLLNAAKTELTAIASYSQEDDIPRFAGAVFPLASNLAKRQVVESGRFFIVTPENPGLLAADSYQHLQAQQVEALLIVPLLARGEVIGTINIGLGQLKHEFTAAEVELAETIAGQIAGAIENARLYTLAQEARTAAEAANQAKSTFLATMSHELRTPLNAILGYTQILKRDLSSPEPQQERLNIIEQSAGHLLMLINDVLDLAKIEAGKMELQLANFFLPAFLKEIGEIIRVWAERKNLDFYLEHSSFGWEEGLPVEVYGDEKRLRQVLINLLGNAVKFTQQGSVRLKVKPAENDRIRFQVEDTGVGISPSDRQIIFEPFQQVGRLKYQIEGTGLGLSISRNLVELMGGDLQVESIPDQGSRFWFDIPLSAVSWTAEFTPDETWPLIEAPDRPAETGESWIIPPPAEITTLLELSLMGDVEKIQERLVELVSSNSQLEPFAAELQELAKRFQLNDISRLLAEYLDNNP